MYTAYLKIRDRKNHNAVMKCLNAGLGTFSDKEKFEIIIYNENNSTLPEIYYKTYKIINRNDLLQNKDCIELNKLINSSLISPGWKPAAFALCAPSFYMKDNIHINTDQCDQIMYGPAEQYILKAIDIIKQNNLPCLNYDYILSHNPFYTRKFILSHFSYGQSVCDTNKMKELIYFALNNSKQTIEELKGINQKIEFNIDIAISNILTKSHYPYIAFTTKEGLTHQEDDFFFTRWDTNKQKIESRLHGKSVFVEKHPKTIIF